MVHVYTRAWLILVILYLQKASSLTGKCFQCNNAESEAECTDAYKFVACDFDHNSCQTRYSWDGSRLSISKSCEAHDICRSNQHDQLPMNACNNPYAVHPNCYYCCDTEWCNAGQQAVNSRYYDPKCDIGERSFNDEWCVMLRPLTPESHDNDYLSSDTWCKRQGYIGVFAPVDENLSKQLLAWMANIKPGGPLLQLYGGHYDRQHFNVDDGCWLSFEKKVKLFGKFYSPVHVCSNGIISLGPTKNIMPTFESSELKSDSFIIAPFWADVDLRKAGELWAREIIDERALQPISDIFSSAYRVTFKAKWALVATWKNVIAYGRQADEMTNTFQCVVAMDDDYNTYVQFTYDQITWSTGVKHLGQLPDIGFYPGDESTNYFTMSQSQTIFSDIVRKSNVGKPGQWLFKVDGLSVSPPEYNYPVWVDLEYRDKSLVVKSSQEQTDMGDWSIWRRGYDPSRYEGECIFATLDGWIRSACSAPVSGVACYTGIRAVEGGWAMWSDWSDCSAPCGKNSVIHRNRTCTNPPPIHSGRCPGEPTEYIGCDKPACEDAHEASTLSLRLQYTITDCKSIDKPTLIYSLNSLATSLEGFCQPDCKQGTPDFSYTCEGSLFSVIWPTDIVSVNGIPEDLKVKIEAKIKEAGSALNLKINENTTLQLKAGGDGDYGTYIVKEGWGM